MAGAGLRSRWQVDGKGRSAADLALDFQRAAVPADDVLDDGKAQSDTARSRQLGGTGLGLAIVKHIVSRHRGALEIKSQVGSGSTFSVYLPAAKERGAGPASR